MMAVYTASEASPLGGAEKERLFRLIDRIQYRREMRQVLPVGILPPPPLTPNHKSNHVRCYRNFFMVDKMSATC
jgi:hypothetical protein